MSLTRSDDRNLPRALYRAPEAQVILPLLDAATAPPDVAARIAARARGLVQAARAAHRPGADMADLLNEYGLDTREGVALLCLAEALLRIPDTETADALIADRFAGVDWEAHLGHADNLTINASSWAFMLTGRVVTLDEDDGGGFSGVIRRMVRRIGPVLHRLAKAHRAEQIIEQVAGPGIFHAQVHRALGVQLDQGVDIIGA